MCKTTLSFALISERKSSLTESPEEAVDIKLTLSQGNVLITLETITESRVIKHDTDACQDRVAFRHYRH